MSSSKLSARNFARTMHLRENSQIASATSRGNGKQKDMEEEEGPRDMAAKTIETDLRVAKERRKANTTRAKAVAKVVKVVRARVRASPAEAEAAADKPHTCVPSCIAVGYLGPCVSRTLDPKNRPLPQPKQF